MTTLPYCFLQVSVIFFALACVIYAIVLYCLYLTIPFLSNKYNNKLLNSGLFSFISRNDFFYYQLLNIQNHFFDKNVLVEQTFSHCIFYVPLVTCIYSVYKPIYYKLFLILHHFYFESQVQ